jgi:hypothetical protein
MSYSLQLCLVPNFYALPLHLPGKVSLYQQPMSLIFHTFVFISSLYYSTVSSTIALLDLPSHQKET